VNYSKAQIENIKVCGKSLWDASPAVIAPGLFNRGGLRLALHPQTWPPE